MRVFLRYTIIAMLVCATHGLAFAASNSPLVWLQVSIEEINSASPIIGSATLPLPLTGAIVNAVPEKIKNDWKEDGFDVEAIFETVNAMRGDDTFALTKNDYHLVIKKFTKTPISTATPSYFKLKSNKFSLPIPLMITSTAVRVIQLAFRDLKIDNADLARVMEELKSTPPGLLLKGEDKLLDSWLEIRLE